MPPPTIADLPPPPIDNPLSKSGLAGATFPKTAEFGNLIDGAPHYFSHPNYANSPLPTIEGAVIAVGNPLIERAAATDGAWHHVDSYTPARAARPDTVALWHKITTTEDKEWTRRYHSQDPKEKAFGGRVVVTLKNGTVIEDELALADAHPDGARPFVRENYKQKFLTLSDGIIAPAEQTRFLQAAESLLDLKAGDLAALNFVVEAGKLGAARPSGIFDFKG